MPQVVSVSEEPLNIQTTFEFAAKDHGAEAKASAKAKRSGAFTDNMSLPVHRWFRYSAGFSAEWVEKVIEEQHFEAKEYLFDPFVGSGTSLLAASKKGILSAGVENHGFVHRIADAKLQWSQDVEALHNSAQNLLARAQTLVKLEPETKSVLLSKCYTPEALCRLEALKNAYLERATENTAVDQLLWLAITAILRECSGVGTAQWQYVLPNKTKTRVKDPFLAFATRIEMFGSDILTMAPLRRKCAVDLKLGDARDLSTMSHLKGRVRLVVTSPPYPNNYDYADATRLEMTFWNEVSSWGDLQSVVRHRLVRSCSQHSAAERLSLRALLSDPAISPIKKELASICSDFKVYSRN